MPIKIVHPIDTTTFTGDCRTWPTGVYTTSCSSVPVSAYLYIDAVKRAFWIDPASTKWVLDEFSFNRGNELWKRTTKITMEFS